MDQLYSHAFTTAEQAPGRGYVALWSLGMGLRLLVRLERGQRLAGCAAPAQGQHRAATVAGVVL